jgi:hypothetical protein
MADTTPPTVTIVSIERTKISDEPGKQDTDIVFKFNEAVTAWSVRKGGVDHGTGIELSGDIGSWFPIFPVNVGIHVAADTEIEITIDYTDLDIGANQINFYGRDEAGNWVPYNQA